MSEQVCCPVCGVAHVERWDCKDGFNLFVCAECSHRFVDPSQIDLDFGDANKFRDHITNQLMESDAAYYEHLCLSEVTGGHTWLTSQLILNDVQQTSTPVGARWLDVGSGSGYLVAEAQKLGARAVGIEPGYWGQIAARAKGIEIKHGVLTPTTFPDKFAIITATDVLEHQPVPHQFLSLLKSYMAMNSRMYLSFPHGGSWRARLLKARWPMVTPPTHCQFFTRKSFEKLVTQLGLTVQRWEHYNSGGIPGLGRLGISVGAANRLAHRFGWGDQVLVSVGVSGIQNAT